MGSSSESRPRFRTRAKQAPAPADAESLFGELPRTPQGVGALWSHQADLLRTYHGEHTRTRDVALELPTGSGKTLVGLLIAEWRRRANGERVVYACPTKQLAHQVVAAARAQSIPAVTLIGSHKQWATRDVADYTAGGAIAVSTYSHIFNSNSYLADAQVLLFDDAHSAEGYVAECWALKVEASEAAYDDLLDVVRDSLDPLLVARLARREAADAAADAWDVGSSDEMPNAGAYTKRDEVWLLPISVVDRHLDDIDSVLAAGLAGGGRFAFSMIRDGLRSCLFYLTPTHWYIRPFIPPTFAYPAFVNPVQRIYLSATLGESGELERAFGRPTIARIPVPPAWERTGSGRRFFAFPDLADTPSGAITSTTDLTAALMRVSDKQLVLTPDNRRAVDVENYLQTPQGERFSARTEGGIQPFLDADKGTLFAPSRYDGMDLSGNTCRLMLMSGLPDAVHAQDRFIEYRLRASNVLDERVRTRITQGAGRCTRGPKDYAVVIVEGEDLLRFLSRREIQLAMPVELQAEVAFGLHNSSVPADDLVSLARSAIEQDDVWQEDAEPDISERRRDAVKVITAEARNLGESASREVRACDAAWQQNWDDASRLAHEVQEHLTAPGVRAYRGLWAYLASAWSELAAQQGSPGAHDRAAHLLRIAHHAATGTTWLRDVQPLPNANPASDPTDDAAVARVIEVLDGELRSPTKFDKFTSEMLSRLNQKGASGYEQGLVALGTLVGAESQKPDGKGRADAVWVWPDFWITFEAKSEQRPDGPLSMSYVRQANTQLDLVRSDRGADDIPDGSVSVVVTPRRVVDPDAVPIAAPHLHLASPNLVLDIALDVVRAWKSLRIEAQGSAGDAQATAVAAILWGHRALPTQVRERLTADPIRVG